MEKLPRGFEVIDDAMAEVLRAKSPAERLAIAHGMWSHASQLLQRVIKAEHPDWTPQQIQSQVAQRLLNGAI
ncbi:MAG: hypothetical protein SH868_06935 [Bythopirellula sp.]|nr:hypothetical protein [Bythopirellula sp.]